MPSYLMSANDRWLSAPATMILFFWSRHDERVYWIVVLAADMANLPVDTGSKCENEMLISLRAGSCTSCISCISIVLRIFRSDVASRGSAHPPAIRGAATQWSLRTADVAGSPGEAVALCSFGPQGPTALREHEAAKCLFQTRGGWVWTMGPVES